MSEFTDFDDQTHRVASAAASFQKGLYHLFTLRCRLAVDSYERLLRAYQCLFQMCATLLLLDESFSLNDLLKRKGVPGQLKSRCADSKNPTRKELDPASVVTHSTFVNGKWRGLPGSHPLADVSTEALDLFSRAVDARHNLIYRPFLLDSHYWEDCTLIELMGRAPEPNEIESLYHHFASAVWKWREGDRAPNVPPEFIFSLFRRYRDRSGARPDETLLLTYGRMLNPDNEPVLTELRNYRNRLVDQDNRAAPAGIGFPPSLEVGEV